MPIDWGRDPIHFAAMTIGKFYISHDCESPVLVPSTESRGMQSSLAKMQLDLQVLNQKSANRPYQSCILIVCAIPSHVNHFIAWHITMLSPAFNCWLQQSKHCDAVRLRAWIRLSEEFFSKSSRWAKVAWAMPVPGKKLNKYMTWSQAHWRVLRGLRSLYEQRWRRLALAKRSPGVSKFSSWRKFHSVMEVRRPCSLEILRRWQALSHDLAHTDAPALHERSMPASASKQNAETCTEYTVWDSLGS